MRLKVLLDLSLPINIPEILKFGIIGLGAIMAVLAFWLLRNEQDKPKPRPSILKSIYIFMGFSLLLVITGLLAPIISRQKPGGYVVPPEEKVIVNKLPASTYGEYELIKDMSIFDLRGWKPVSDEEKKVTKISPANYINYLHIKKTRPIDSIVAHYSTGGSDIDLRCITHSYNIYQQTNDSSHPGEKNYGIAIDVSAAPVGEEFLVVVEATYWNGFSDMLKESASTYTDKEVKGLEELSLIVLLPFDKPVIAVEKFYNSGKGQQAFRDAEKYYVDKNKRFIYWNIKNPVADTHYQLDWTW